MRNPAIQNDFSYYRRTISRNRINNMHVSPCVSLAGAMLSLWLLHMAGHREKAESLSIACFQKWWSIPVSDPTAGLCSKAQWAPRFQLGESVAGFVTGTLEEVDVADVSSMPPGQDFGNRWPLRGLRWLKRTQRILGDAEVLAPVKSERWQWSIIIVHIS